MLSKIHLMTVGAVLMLATPALADGAIAVGGGSFGFSRNHPSSDVAANVALGNCGNSACRIVMTYRNACAAVAMSRNGHWGWAILESEAGARQRAVENCMDRGGDYCSVKTNLGYECDGS